MLPRSLNTSCNNGFAHVHFEPKILACKGKYEGSTVPARNLCTSLRQADRPGPLQWSNMMITNGEVKEILTAR
jgi:hypothetical protein